MDSNRSGRRRFLKHAAALAGLAAGAAPPASGQSAGSEAQPKDVHIHGEPSRFATTPGSGRGVRLRLDHMTYYTPLQDSAGIITPASLHFMQTHSSHLPDINPQQHRLTIHGMVDRPLSFSLADLKRLPSVNRIYFVECHGNGSSTLHSTDDPKMGLPVQYIHGMTSCSEWTGVTFPSSGFYEIIVLAGSGGGVICKVDVSTDVGQSWKDAKLQTRVHPKAHTRFTFDCTWDGEEAVLQSRCTDELGEVQPSLAELYKNWGITDVASQKTARAIHINAIQPWKVDRDGSVHDAMFS